MELKLKDRVAFITGANRGIGAAIAEALAAEGMHLALFGRDVAGCEAVAQKIKSKNAATHIAVVPLDFQKLPAKTKEAVAAAVKELGGVDVLVNCAGGAYRAAFTEIPDEKWPSEFAVKPFGLVSMTREALPYLKKSDQGRVINIAGTRGREPAWFSIMSGAVNLATLSITKSFANRFGEFGITVNAICPGSTDTRRWTETVKMTSEARGISTEDAKKLLLQDVPMGRVVMPDDIAAAVVFLASAGAGMITGVALNVDGGRTRSAV